MPRKGPAKSTRREERASEKEATNKQRLKEEAKKERAAQAVREYRCNAEIPQSKGQQRDLRRGLNEEGLVYERYGESPSQLGKRGEILEKSSGGRMEPRGFECWGDDQPWE
ncbi:hypothetical protein THRCLA_22797 [Thraustotheca clavata]|uniref:Uncharacterized protein n=1 Tax=Thraustotheca clavata TaxID=74557 RepID=A0A1V9YSX4_9STRA|nr:hypothetical protein THRCLA_22797 [Thraustotheca clavata]